MSLANARVSPTSLPFAPQNAPEFLRFGETGSNPTSDMTLEKNQEQLWDELRRFYDENEQVIERSLALDAEKMARDEKASELDMAVDTFMETANVVMEGLVALGNVHPILGVAIFAFHGIIKLDIARRDNNRKVLAVKLQMQNMMCAMFQLRKLKHIHVEEKEKEQERTGLRRLVAVMADEITECGSNLNYYVGRKFVSKLINAKSYERLFAEHIEVFAQRRAELQSMITSYIAAGVDAANIGIADVGRKINVLDKKIDFLVSIFRQLDTPCEQDVLRFMEQNGGAQKCVEKDELLMKLLTKAGESSGEGKVAIIEGDELAEIRDTLTAELEQAKDIKSVLAENLPRFTKILNVQNNNLKLMTDHLEEQGQEMQEQTLKLDQLVQTSILILEEGRLIKKAVAPNASMTLKDPVLQQIWDRVGLKGSVKAKHFVLTFRDHFILTFREYLLVEHSAPASLVGSPRVPIIPLSPVQQTTALLFSPAVHDHQPLLERPVPALLRPEFDDIWALQYLNAAHAQPVIEALDEDGSGFISVKEAKNFALSRPRGWSLMRWLGYWAAGWHINITSYRCKIYSIVQRMHEVLLTAHPANRSYVDEYLNHPSMNRLEALLRSTKSLPDGAPKDSKLMEAAELMASLQEERLMSNLREMSFVMESPADVTLVAGSGKVETWILPLLYLILNRHLDILKLGQGRVLETKELALQVKSLQSVFSVFDERMHILDTTFRQSHRDVLAQFENFAYGMFLASFVNGDKNPSENTLLTFRDNKNSVSKITQSSNPKSSDDVSILARGLGPVFEFVEVNIECEKPPSEHVPHPFEEGIWTGQCIRANNQRIAFQGFFQCTINPIIDGNISGQGETYLGGIEIAGELVGERNGSGGKTLLEFRVYSDEYADLWCKGEYDPKSEFIKGKWVIDDNSDFPTLNDEAEEKAMDLQRPCGRFYITRTPAAVFRFRHLLDKPSPDQAWTVARRRWAFATQAVRFQTQDRIGSANFFRARTAERREWVELTIRREFDKAFKSVAGKEQLSTHGRQELWALRLQMHPINGRLYDSLAIYLFKRMSYNVGLYNCKSCDRRIIFARFQCITCMDEKLSSQLDLCGDCIEAPIVPIDGDFAHHTSHSLIRSTHRIHDCELASMIPQTRIRSERLKASFKAAEIKASTIKNLDNDGHRLSPLKTPPSPFACACCKNSISLPCWVCVACALDTFICYDCDTKRRPVLKREGFSAAHSYDHPLLRLHDSCEVKLSEVKANRIERRMGEMEARINNTLSSLQEKVNQQLEDLKTGMKFTVEEIATSEQRTVADHKFGARDIDADVEITLRNPMPTNSHALLHSPPARCVPGGSEQSYNNNTIPLEGTLERRLQLLEAKVESQFDTILALLQQIVPSSPNPILHSLT